MSTLSRESRNAPITPLSIVVADPPANIDDEKAFSWWTEGTMEWTEFDCIELPPDAAASVVALDKVAIRKLAREFDVKLNTRVADIFAFAKLVDAVRLAGDRESKQLCLLALEKAHEKKERAWMQEAFERKGLFSAEDVCMHKFMGLCAIARLGIVYPKGAELPQVAIAVPNLIEGLKLQIVLSLQASRASAHCERCASAYIRHTRDQKFCSERCASRERQARYRANRVKRGKQF